MTARAGRYRTNHLNGETYESFVPSKLPPNPNIEIDDETTKLLIKANGSISALENISARIPNRLLFITAYVRKEALMSSQIEGTQATLEDVFDPLIETNSNRDVEEVVNYINAANYAIDRLKTLPLCNRLICETHRVLMAGVRGQDKHPGEFRPFQNFIGRRGANLKSAYYIPPCREDMLDAMSDLEVYMNEDDDTDVLIQAALIHYQFEIIHPFLDGNGRLGRMLIILFLMSKKVLTTPALYLSYFLKKYQSEYYTRLSEVREKGRYEQWIKFFLKAIDESANDAVKTINELVALHDKNEAAVQSLGRARLNARRVFDYLAACPIIEINKTAEALGLSFNTVSAAINRLVDIGILEQTKGGRRNKIFAYKDYLDILRRGT